MTEEELILSLCREAREEGSDEDLIEKFRERHRDQSELIWRACQGDSKALRRLRWLCGLRVVTKLGIWEGKKEPSRRERTRGSVIVRRAKNIRTPINHKRKGIKDERKELIERAKDKILNISRARQNVGEECIVCGNEIKKNQAFRVLPKDKSCQEPRFYHLRTCGPGSNNWKAFKANGKKVPDKSLHKGQLSFRWEAITK